MFFDNAEGQRMMCIHAPERHMCERAHLFNVRENNGVIEIAEEICM